MPDADWTPAVQQAPSPSPFRRRMDNALVGLLMTLFTLNVPGLNAALCLAGVLLMLLGFRALRRAHRAFFACYLLSIAKAALTLNALILNATICTELLPAPVRILSYAGAAVTVLLLLFLRSGLRSIQRSAGISPHTGSVSCLLVISLLAFTQMQFSGLLLLAVLLAAVIAVIRRLSALVRELEEAGPVLSPAPVRIPDRRLTGILLLVLTLGIIGGYGFLGRYPMDWQPVSPDEQADVQEIRQQLLQLGFPESVLNDLTPEDIRACQGALEVVVQTEDHPANDGREVRTTTGTYTQISRVYDDKELRITGVAVKLPGGRETWMLFHHFLWTENPGFPGTEALQLWPTTSDFSYSVLSAPFTGRVLYDDGGTVRAAPYFSLGEDTWTQDSPIWGSSQTTAVFAAFSPPASGQNCRGYLAYGAEFLQEGVYVSSWLNYIHQDSRLQYPVQTAREYRMNGDMFSRGPFRVIQDALQFSQP